MAEGAQDRNLNKITSDAVKTILSERLKLDTRVTVLGHTQRGGPACAYDRWLATLQGTEAVRAVLESTPSTPSPIITIRENKIERGSLVDAVAATKKVSKCIADRDFEEAMKLRDAEFKAYHRAYINTTTPTHPKMLLPQEKVGHICLPLLLKTADQYYCRECELPSFTSAPQPVA